MTATILKTGLILNVMNNVDPRQLIQAAMLYQRYSQTSQWNISFEHDISLQPLDAGIIRSFKCKYRHEQVRSYINMFESKEFCLCFSYVYACLESS